jgi:hypothetical protein
MNQIEFKYETFLEGKHKLVTRGEIEVQREYIKPKDHPTYKYSVWVNGFNYSVTNNGFRFSSTSESEYDLFMIPIKSIQTDETIPFDLGKFKSGEWDVVSDNGLKVEYATILSYERLLVCYGDMYDIFGFGNQHISLRKKPISPFTHPHLYEVSNDEINWRSIKKYYDFIEGSECPHKYLSPDFNRIKASIHLRLKQPTEISKDQAFDVVANLDVVKEKLTEKFGTFKIKSL